ncbi:MAG: alcohol dehydrogenase catalytic domain-containing protein [Euryarchaeota archaeon]|jgi:threonine 3-dehydrogenase|nr:alcohol dehydrogenase catalytic domain-containing protein [Euryarchaeota archaeon]
MSEAPGTMMAWTKVHDTEDGFELIEHPVPSPAPGEVLVKTASTSICGTDLHIWLWDEWSRDEVPLGTITGHETCGEVVALGEGVSSHKIGDQVAIECHLACWNCPRCDEGNAHICENGSIFGVHDNGAFAPYFTIPATNARHTPDGLDSVHGSIQDPLGNAIHTLTGGPVEGATIAIHGLGPIGLFAVNAAKAMGASKVIAIDWDNKYRMGLAEKLGADLVLGKGDNIIETILSETDGRGVDNTCEFSGSPVALANAIRSTRMGGYLNVLSVYGNSTPEVPMNDLVFRYLHLKGINGRKMWSTWDTMHDLLSSGAIDVDSIVTHRLGISEFQKGMELTRSGLCGKVVLDF